MLVPSVLPRFIPPVRATGPNSISALAASRAVSKVSCDPSQTKQISAEPGKAV